MEILEGIAKHGIAYSLVSLGVVLFLSGIGLAKFGSIQATTGKRTWITGLILLACGIGAILFGELGIPYQEQKVAWAPDRGGPPGIDIREPKTAFIPWNILKNEITDRMFLQINQIPIGSTARVNSFKGKLNHIVEVVDPSGEVIGNVWFGKNPRNNAFNWDGIIRVGVAGVPEDGSQVVWESFKRYQDGSYVKIREQ